MDQESWMYLKAALPGLAFMALSAFVLLIMSRMLGGSELGAALFRSWRWVPAGAMSFGFLMLCWRTFRVQQALNGDGLICPNCAGPLGSERNGRYGPYRKCMNCSRNVAQRHYH